VFSGEIISGSIAVAGGYIVGFGDYPAKHIISVSGKFLAPGFIDPHVHIESSMVCVSEFARAVLPCGTTTVVADPHEIANVLGVGGIRYMLDSAENQPMNVYYTLPSCVPATHLETAGAILDSEKLSPLMGENRILALAEMMNYPGVIFGDAGVLAKIGLAERHRKPIDGHSPGLSGKDLYAYLSAGISSDHECTALEEAREKLRAGMQIMVREGTGAKNLKTLLPLVNEDTYRRMMWCTDDRHPHDLLSEGHIDSMIREAIGKGIPPIMAIRMATLNPALYFGIRDAGAIAPGRKADFIVFSDLDNIRAEQVYCKGVLVAENGHIEPDIPRPALPFCPGSMNVNAENIDFSIPALGKKIRVIELIENQIVTNSIIADARISENQAVSDTDRDILKIAVIERHNATGNIGKAFVNGFGLKRGALASSVAHDSHNIIVVGTNDADMKAAVEAVIAMRGGLAAVCNRELLASLSLPIAGLMSEEPISIVRDKLDKLIDAAAKLGCRIEDPFMTLSFLALPVIPALKITDKGLVDVNQFGFVPLFAEK
jgi:adenine deaminase